MTCISRPMPESLSSSWTSIKRQLLPLISYSLAPSRNIRRVIDTSEYSIGSALSELSMVTVTSARPSGARDEVPAKMTSSILPPRSVLAPCSPITQARASTTLDLPEPLGPTTRGDARLETQSRRRREGLEALQRQTLEVHGVPAYRRRPRASAAAWRVIAREIRSSARGSPTSRRRRCRRGPACRRPQQLQQLSPACAGPARRPAPGRRPGCAAYPVRPSSSARDRVHQRKPTPWTCPCTQAVSRTCGPSRVGHDRLSAISKLTSVPDFSVRPTVQTGRWPARRPPAGVPPRPALRPDRSISRVSASSG